MATDFHGFKRLVLGLQSGAPDPAMRLVVDLANLLRLDLIGLFLEDASLRHLAGIPFAREFRLLGGGWHAIERDRWSDELELAARSSERAFAAAAKRLSTRYRFEIVRGPAPVAIETVSHTDDIVVVVTPANPAELVTQQFARLVEAAFRSSAAVMFVPPQVARTSGPIVAVTAGSDDPSILAAAAIAAASNERLIVAGADEGSLVRARALIDEIGLSAEYVPASAVQSDSARTMSALRPLRERLVVMARGLANELAVSIAASRRVPVLAVERWAAEDRRNG
jgi:hypothetical protein